MIDHDAPPGPLIRCQICGSSHLELVIDLGHQPPCDALLSAAQLNEPETTYPLRLMQCQECTLAQLDYVVPAAKVYPHDYPYRAGLSWPVVAAHKLMAAQLFKRFCGMDVVDIGCNDGTLLKEFNALGCHVVGVEPTGVARLAIEDGIPVHQEPFTEALAKRITEENDRATLITMTNVFAHMGDLGEVMRGLSRLCYAHGVIVIENHYLVDVLERNQFDTIYHEHIRTYTLKSLVCLFKQYNMEVFDVERVGRYGGNIRVFVGKPGMHSMTAAVGELLALEDGGWTPTAWSRWRGRVYGNRDAFMTTLYHTGGDVAGCSAPGRASTLLNFYGVTPDLLPYTGELQGSFKLGKYVPGCHVPIVDNKRLAEEQPRHIVLLAWHYADEIIARLRREGFVARLIVPLPLVKVVAA